MVQLFQALSYMPEGRCFNSRWCHWNFPLTYPIRPHCGPEVDIASNRNEYQGHLLGGKGGRCVGLITLQPSCTDCIEIWEPKNFWNPLGLSRREMGLLYLLHLPVLNLLYRLYLKCLDPVYIIIIIIIIIINCNWVVTRWQWLFYMYTKYEIGY